MANYLCCCKRLTIAKVFSKLFKYLCNDSQTAKYWEYCNRWDSVTSDISRWADITCVYISSIRFGHSYHELLHKICNLSNLSNLSNLVTKPKKLFGLFQNAFINTLYLKLKDPFTLDLMWCQVAFITPAWVDTFKPGLTWTSLKLQCSFSKLLLLFPTLGIDLFHLMWWQVALQQKRDLSH